MKDNNNLELNIADLYYLANENPQGTTFISEVHIIEDENGKKLRQWYITD